MPASIRFTSTGACASCGFYRGGAHEACPRAERTGAPLQLQPSRRAAIDARTSAAVRQNERIQRFLAGDL